jgi:hypothetical protein
VAGELEIKQIAGFQTFGLFTTLLNVSPIREFSRRINRGSDADQLFDDLVTPVVDRLPLISKTSFAKEIAPVIVNVDLLATISSLLNNECKALGRYTETDASDCALMALDGLLETFFERLSIPVVRNEASDEQLEAIIEGVSYFDHAAWHSVDIRCLSLPHLPVVVLPNENIRTSVLSGLALPICSNFPSQRLLSELVTLAPPPVVRTDVDALLRFSLEEAEVYMNDGIANDVLRSVLPARLPITANCATEVDIAALLAGLPLPLPASAPDLRALASIDPHHRGIDFAGLARGCSVGSGALPLSRNACGAAAARAILAGFELCFLGFAPRDALPLAHFEPPEDAIVLLDSTVDALVALVLARDVVPALPLGPDVDSAWARAALAPLLGDPLPAVVDLPLDFLRHFARLDIPPYIGPADVVDWVLYQHILPFIPLAAADVDDLLLLDGGPALDNDDDLRDPDVQAMLSKYTKPRARVR